MAAAYELEERKQSFQTAIPTTNKPGLRLKRSNIVTESHHSQQAPNQVKKNTLMSSGTTANRIALMGEFLKKQVG